MFDNLLGKSFGNRRAANREYDEDFFKDSRMSFGDHLEELRWRMWRALKGLAFCLVIGFILDNVGDYLDRPWIGVGKPMLRIIVDPVESQVKEFYRGRFEATRVKLADARKSTEVNKINQTAAFPVKIPVQAFLDHFEGLTPKNPAVTDIECTLTVTPTDVEVLSKQGEYLSDSRKYLVGMGVMEAFMVYIKVSLLCGVVIACPWLFWQMWAFIGAGLYPHEKKLIHIYLPFSIFLFLSGCLVCQFLVMPKAVEAMLGFYSWINIDPDLRLNEWLGFAIMMPLVFGVAFQTPLVMVFLNRIGIFTWQYYLSKWRQSMFVLAVLSAVLTPSVDVVSMLLLLVPTFGLYMVGTFICYYLPPPALFGPAEEDEAEVGF